MVADKTALLQGLACCTGSESLHKSFLGLQYTDGIKYLADTADSHWLIDAIASYQGTPVITSNLLLQEFQLWILTVCDGQADLRCYPDSPETNDAVISQHMSFTDFPLPEIKLYVENGVLLLPSEH